jgi:raffinose/stachyose/melibiose transport system substrate-binding protein
MKLSTEGRRRAAAVAIPLAAGVILAGCSSSPSSSTNGEEPQTISMVVGKANPNDTYLADAAKAYQDSHPGVTIKVEALPSDSYATAISTRVKGGNPPDIFLTQGGMGSSYGVIPLAKANLLLPLDNSDIANAIPDAAAGLFTSDKKIYGVPAVNNAVGLIYNDALAHKLGVKLGADSTFQDLLEQCGVASKQGVAVVGLAGSIPANPGILALGIAASTVYGATPDWNQQRADGKVKFATTDGWKAALESIKEMNDAGCFQPGAAGAGFDALTNGMGQEKILSFAAPGAATAAISGASGGKVNPVLMPVPAPKGEKTYVLTTAEIALSGSAKTKSPKLVQDFLKYVTSAQGAQFIADKAGSIPAVVTPDTKLPDQYAQISTAVKNNDLRPQPQLMWPNPKVYDNFGSGVTGLLTGQKTVDQVLQQMDTDWG